MSYILNALRKSERERQASEPESIADRIAAHHTQVSRGSLGLIVGVLVAVNIAIVVYFVGFADRSTPTAGEPVAVAKPVEQAKLVITAPTSRANQAVALKQAAEFSRPKAKLPPTRTLIDKTSPTESNKSMAVAKALVSKKKADEDNRLGKEPEPIVRTPNSSLNNPEPVAMQEAVRSEVNKADAAANQTAEFDQAPVAPKRNKIPFLDELPYEFQLSLPTMSINVFSYSSVPSERFVMIDMVKYVPGQSIKDRLEFHEIHPDGIIVTYKGRTFKIRRP